MTRVFRSLSLLLFSLILALSSCNRVPDKHWTAAVPESALAVITPDERSTLSVAMESPFMPFLEDTGPADLRLVTQIETISGNRLLLRGLALHPAGSNKWAPIWITSPGSTGLDGIHSYFKMAFTENTYRFKGVEIYRLFMRDSDVIMFAAELRDWVVISPNSQALEASIRSYLGEIRPMEIPSNLPPNEFVFNFANADILASHLGAVRFRPSILESFTGMTAAPLNVTSRSAPQNKTAYTFEGNITLADQKSPLVRSLTYREGRLQLDRLISSDAAVFGMFYTDTNISFSLNEESSRLDSSLVGQPGLIESIRQTLDLEIGFAGFFTRGFSPLEETTFIRSLRNPTALTAELNRLAERGSIVRANNQYIIRSKYLARLFGSEICPYTEFYARVTGDVIIIAERAGLIQRMTNDMQRRRVMFYDDEYTKIRARSEGSLSAYFYVNSQPFRSFIEPFTDPSADMSAYLGYFDVLTVAIRAEENSRTADFKLETHGLDRVTQPFAERWYFPLDGAELTGPVVIENLLDSRRSDVIFATDNNRVIGLASDGTELFRVSTGSDKPVGSPVIYDWYSNNQKAILIGAGNKIYAWNNRGVTLPNFPIRLDENITAPIRIADVTRSGLPEIIVATGDRQLHVLNQRGINISGWPQNMNSTIRSTPVFTMLNDAWSVLAHSENAVFAWKNDGSLHDGFPAVASAPLTGSPLIHNNAVLSGGADGYMYAFSKTGIFDSGLAEEQRQSSNGSNGLLTQRINVADSPLTLDGLEVSVFRMDGSNVSIPLIHAHSANGSVFLYSPAGTLRFTDNMGHPFHEGHHTIFTDLNRNGRNELIGIADMGRLYSWNTASGDRIQSLPTTAVIHPILTRLDSDSQIHVIAGSREGLRAWAILQ